MELNRVETTLCAFQVGPCREWSEDHIHAHAFASRKCKLGAALDHLIHHPNGINARLVTMMLARKLAGQRIISHKASWDVAYAAMNYWMDIHCPDCNGRGVENFEQDICLTCAGTGRKPPPKSKAVRRAVALLDLSMEEMEMRLRWALAGTT